MKYAVYALFFIISAGTCCPLDCSQVQCPQGYNPFSCPANTWYSEKAAICGCCPGCVRFKGTFVFTPINFLGAVCLLLVKKTNKTLDSLRTAPAVQRSKQRSVRYQELFHAKNLRDDRCATCGLQ